MRHNGQLLEILRHETQKYRDISKQSTQTSFAHYLLELNTFNFHFSSKDIRSSNDMECWISVLDRSFTTSDLELIQMNLRGSLSSRVVYGVTSTNLIKNTFHILMKLRSLKKFCDIKIQIYTNFNTFFK